MTRLSLAIPSKGRLKEKSEAWLASAGFPVTQIGGERGYQQENHRDFLHGAEPLDNADGRDSKETKSKLNLEFLAAKVETGM